MSKKSKRQVTLKDGNAEVKNCEPPEKNVDIRLKMKAVHRKKSYVLILLKFLACGLPQGVLLSLFKLKRFTNFI